MEYEAKAKERCGFCGDRLEVGSYGKRGLKPYCATCLDDPAKLISIFSQPGEVRSAQHARRGVIDLDEACAHAGPERPPWRSGWHRCAHCCRRTPTPSSPHGQSRWSSEPCMARPHLLLPRTPYTCRLCGPVCGVSLRACVRFAEMSFFVDCAAFGAPPLSALARA